MCFLVNIAKFLAKRESHIVFKEMIDLISDLTYQCPGIIN